MRVDDRTLLNVGQRELRVFINFSEHNEFAVEDDHERVLYLLAGTFVIFALLHMLRIEVAGQRECIISIEQIRAFIGWISDHIHGELDKNLITLWAEVLQVADLFEARD